MSGVVEQKEAWTAAPILDAVERYRGTIFDLDSGRACGPDRFAQGRERLIAQFRAQGLAPGDRVLVAIPNGPLFVAALTALLACEAAPLVVHYKTPPAELHRYAERFCARFVACEPGEEEALAPFETSAVFVAFDDHYALHWGRLNVDENKFRGPVLRGVPLHPTSGSTGLPKIALRPGFAAMEEARHYIETMQLDSSDLIAAMPPMSHAYGYGMCVMAPLLCGASIVSTPRFSVKLLQQAMANHPLTVLPTVPAMLDVLMFGGGVVADFTRLRWMTAAGAMLPKKSADMFRERTGVVVRPLYGTTETGGISVATAATGQDVDGRVGPPMEGVEVEVWPHPTAAELGADIGKIFVRSSSMMAGYLDDDGNILEPFTDGWFETGDLARIADDGCIQLRGRDSEMINVSGLKVVPCEVEEAIARAPGVKEVKVYAGEHRSGTQIVKAAVAVEPGVTNVHLRTHCEQHLVYYKRPQSIVLVDALPRNAAGKIIRDQLP